MPREKSPETSPPRKRAPRKTGSAAASASAYPGFVDLQQRSTLIAQAAYFRAMNRGFEPGHELEDWLSAETEVDAELLQGSGATAQG